MDDWRFCRALFGYYRSLAIMKLLLLSFLSLFAMAAPVGSQSSAEAALSVDDSLSLNISQKAVDLIVYYEVGGRKSFEKSYKRPIVPAWQTTQSGVTVCLGFDAGHNTPQQIQKAFEGIISQEKINLLKSVSGMKGANAYYNGLPKVKHLLSFEYEEAEKVFKRDSLPRFSKQTSDAFKLSKDRLHPHSNGALVSLVFNRGASMSSSSSRNEMRYIRTHIANNQDSKIPSEFKSMKRLWNYSSLKGLHLRRDAEAKLFQDGLDARN